MCRLKDECYGFSNVRVGPVVFARQESLLGVGVFNSDGMHTKFSLDII